MATSAEVAIELPDGKVLSIYNHSDGYDGYLGKMLVQHYRDPAKVEELIMNGDASFIDENIGEKIDFHDHSLRAANKQCSFYGRDREEDGTNPTSYHDYDYWLSRAFKRSLYAYIFDTKTNTWAGFYSGREIVLPGNLGLARLLKSKQAQH